MNTKWKAAAGLLLIALAGCGGRKNIVGTQTAVTGMPGGAPAWLSKASYEDNGRFYYRGAVAGRADMALGLREARAEAEKALAEEIKQRIRTEFGSSVQGENLEGGIGSHVTDIIAKVSENVQISGAKLSEQYSQKLEERTAYGLRYVWDCYALMSLTREDYLEARRLTLQGAVAKAHEEKNAKAEAALKEAFRKLDADNEALAAAKAATVRPQAAESR